MARKKRPSAGPGAARFRAAAALDKGKDDDMWGNAPSRHEVAAAKGVLNQVNIDDVTDGFHC